MDNKIVEVPHFPYACWQMSKAIHTHNTHADPRVRKNAEKKCQQWQQIIENLWHGRLNYGSRTPIKDIPNWVTLEVAQGGFATGNLLAGGELQEFELELLKILHADKNTYQNKELARLWLNNYFVSDDGIKCLSNLLKSEKYKVNLPEECALLTVAWVLKNNFIEQAEELLTIISPFFDKLRFYPQPCKLAQPLSTKVHLKNISEVVYDLQNGFQQQRLKVQKIQITIWVPIYDKVVDCLLTANLQQVSDVINLTRAWQQQAQTILNELNRIKKQYPAKGKFAKNFADRAVLLALFSKLVTTPNAITEKEIRRIQYLLNCYVEKNGTPQSQKWQKLRKQQQNSVKSPLYSDLAQIIINKRLTNLRQDTGVDSIEALIQPIRAEEVNDKVAKNSVTPQTIINKLLACENNSIDNLVTMGRVTSSEQLATLLPQITAQTRAIAIDNPTLRHLYANSYQAFRKRRSLLLNLEKQVQLNEIPWIRVLDEFKQDTKNNQTACYQALVEVASLTLEKFPYSIFPNKLLQELKALSVSANLNLPLVEELAVDIFMGEFSPKFTQAVKQTSKLMQDTLYARYFQIDYQLLSLQLMIANKATLTKICAKRAGVQLPTGWGFPSENGMIIEQQQILSTQNLAIICSELDLLEKLPLYGMAQSCFQWLCKRLQANSNYCHAHLIKIKQSAYAWRQMLFYLSFISVEKQVEFLTWAENYLSQQDNDFQQKFYPILQGLKLIQKGYSFSDKALQEQQLQAFLGWTQGNHDLLD